jgi:para-aminobenzoate synthetase component 1
MKAHHKYNSPIVLKLGKGPAALSTAITLPRDLATYFPTVARHPFPFLLESAGSGRFTFLGSNPYAVLVARGDRLSLWREDREKTFRGNPFDVVAELLAERKPENDRDLPLPGGAIGAFGYDLGRHLEKLPRRAEDDLDFPDLLLGFYDRLVQVDHREGRASIVELTDRAERRAIDPRTYDEAFGGAPSTRERGANFTHERYLEAVRRAKEYIAAGDVYQVNLSQRFHARVETPPYEVYRRLREISPAPYAAFFGFGRRAILSASPEQFLELRGRTLVTRPIKGTRRRSDNDDEDERLRQELHASAKDDAELAMIVDLERNDLGRVCEYGSVQVSAAKTLESHPTVHHLVATIEGTLRRGLGPVDVLRATFPGGSVTGAPKIRAMEIIDELEPTRRSFYTGAIGSLGFDGSMNLSIAIRTVIADGSDFFFQAGGGIVADSDPEAEYLETLAKAAAPARALGVSLL